MKPDDFDIIREPRASTKEEDEIRMEIARLHREYQDRIEPLVKRLAEIDAGFAPKFMLVPRPALTEKAE